MGVGADLGGHQGTTQLGQHSTALGPGRGFGPVQNLGCRHALGLDGAQGAGEHRLGNGGCGHTQIERHLAGPFACAFLFGGVQNHVHQRRTGLRVGALKDLCGDVDQVTAQLTLVPGGEHFAHFGGRHAQLLHEGISLTNHLHVGVFDGVVHHLHKMACTARPHPLAAGLAIFGFGGNRLQQRLDQWPGLGGSARHEGRAPQSTFFATTHTRAHIQNARCTQRVDAPLGVGEQRVAAVDQHIAGRHEGGELRQHLVNGRASGHHQPNAPGHRQAAHQFGQAGAGLSFQALGALREVVALVGIEVKARYRKAVALQVQGEVFTHHAQAHEADVHGLHL